MPPKKPTLSAIDIPDSDIFIDIAAVTRRTTYGLQQLYRLERAGQFPRRIKIGAIRVGWSLDQIIAWMQAKADARHGCDKVIIGPQDRFIHKPDVQRMVLLSVNRIRDIEYKGEFPKRISITTNRVVWLEREIRDWMDSKMNPPAVNRPTPIYEDEGTLV